MHQNGFEIVPLISRDLVIVLFIGSLIQQKSEYANRSRDLEGKVAKSFAQYLARFPSTYLATLGWQSSVKEVSQRVDWAEEV